MRVLLVDPDGTLLPEIAPDLGTRRELEVHCQTSPEAALEHARSLGGVDVLLTEAFLPGMDGFALQSALQELRPSLLTIYLSVYDLSGYSDSLSGALVLNRPVPQGHLLAALEPALDQAPKIPSPLREGDTLGTFRLLREIGNRGWITQFAAVQIGLNRAAQVNILDPKEALDPGVRNGFLAHAGAKARLVHPAILAIYEAGEADGWTFYASERIEAPHLQLLQERGSKLSPSQLYRVARTVAHVYQHLDTHNIPWRSIGPADIFLTSEGALRITNPATNRASKPNSLAIDMALLGSALLDLLPENTPKSFVHALERTQPGHPSPRPSGEAFLKETAVLEGFLGPDSHFRSKNRAPLSRSHLALLHSLVFLGVLSLLLVLGRWSLERFEAEEVALPPPILIPPGTYLIGKGHPVSLPSFWIDRTEISVEQYARFLNWLAHHPQSPAEFNHPSQPPHHAHTPDHWDAARIASLARRQSPKNAPELQRPVTGVSWWNAFAFAKWAGRELPSPEEWEAAARGPKGLLFPWGDQADPSLATVQPQASKHFPLLLKPSATLPVPNSPGSAMSQPDLSPMGVLGMAGNVSEWTNASNNLNRFTVKGGHFAAPLDPLDSFFVLDPSQRKPFVGFRTVSHKSLKP
ncbi:MAG: hypothetical protein RLZZ244_468 [Verrucomicrobiota bacterium]